MSGQIDYLMQTRHNVLYVCEIKFSKELVTSEVVDEVKQKISQLKPPKNFTFMTVLLHVNGVSEAVLESRFFSSIVDFGVFLQNKNVT